VIYPLTPKNLYIWLSLVIRVKIDVNKELNMMAIYHGKPSFENTRHLGRD
jgi:hypothetical protein